MKIYEVGGCVRDRLLGLTPHDIDYVVVGATEQDMLDRGFQRVGLSFPVFLDPETKSEYALARSERKTGTGYTGFDVDTSPCITLEDDLLRRDLTINAMAYDRDTDTIIDPYGGQEDLRNGILKHVSSAFAEDPLRILRVARFAARYGFTVHEDTKSLMRQIVHELETIPHDRIWKELSRGFEELYPSKLFEVLADCGALNLSALKCWNADNGIYQLKTTDTARSVFNVCAIMTQQFSDDDYATQRIPTHIAEVCKLYHTREVYDTVICWEFVTPKEKVAWMERTRTIHNPTRMHDLMSIFRSCCGNILDNHTLDQIAKDVQAVNDVVIDPSTLPSDKTKIKEFVRQQRSYAL